MVYYVTLVSVSEELVGQIPALMFSSHNSTGKRTNIAELLPFRVITCEWSDLLLLTPMLRDGYFKRMFGKGCNFKVLALVGIRAVDWSVECPWKKWDLQIKEKQKVIRDIIYEDIRQIPKNMLKALKPFKCNETFKKQSSLPGRGSFRSQISSKEKKLLENTRKCRLSDYCADLGFTGLVAGGGSSFAEWFQTIPPKICIDQNFKCKQGTVLTKDNFSHVKNLENYLRFPGKKYDRVSEKVWFTLILEAKNAVQIRLVGKRWTLFIKKLWLTWYLFSDFLYQ